MTALLAAWAIAKRVFGLLPVKDWLWIGLVAGLLGYHALKVHEARNQGRDEAAAACVKREQAAREQYDREVKALDEKYRGIEQQQATELAVAGENYAAQLHALEDQRRTDVARARAGALVVRVPGACPASDRATPESPAAPARSDGPAGCQLSAAAGANLLDLIADADRNTRQLTACQTVIATYLKGNS